MFFIRLVDNEQTNYTCLAFECNPRNNDVYMMMLFNVNYKFGSTKGAPRFFSTF